MTGLKSETEEAATSGYESDMEGILPGRVVRSLYLPGGPMSRRRRDRTHFSPPALGRLEAVFTLDPYPDIQLREDLARELKVTEDRIQVWFQNRRSKLKRHKRTNCSRFRERNEEISVSSRHRRLQDSVHSSSFCHTPPEASTLQTLATAQIPVFLSPVNSIIPNISPWSFIRPSQGFHASITPMRWFNSPENRLLPCSLPFLSPDVTTHFTREDATSPTVTATPPSTQKFFVRPWE